MKKILLLLVGGFICIAVQAQQDTTRYIWNPMTGKQDYISQVRTAVDSVINFGTNNTLSEDTLNGVIGHHNTISAASSMGIGYYNTTTRANNMLFGAFTQADTTYTMTIGRGLGNAAKLVNSTYGTIGLGYFATEPVLYIQSGYENGETYTADIGGVSIGGPALDTLTSLQINKHLSGSAYFLKCKNASDNAVFSVDYDGNADLDGTLTADSVICNYVPTIHQAAGDTSNYNTPDKVGDMFIDTSSDDAYISVGSTRGDWIKL